MKTLLYGAMAALVASIAQPAMAGGEDIYPQGFVDDCSYSLVESDLMAKIWVYTGNELDKAKAAKAYEAKCTCLSDKFFATEFNDIATAYETQMLLLQYRDVRGVSVRLKTQFRKNISQCDAVAQKARVDEGVKKFDQEKKTSSNTLKDSFMADIRANLGNNVNEGYLRKADYISTCVAKRVGEFNKTNPDLATLMTTRMHENLRKGEYINVNDNPKVENHILTTYDHCW